MDGEVVVSGGSQWMKSEKGVALKVEVEDLRDQSWPRLHGSGASGPCQTGRSPIAYSTSSR